MCFSKKNENMHEKEEPVGSTGKCKNSDLFEEFGLRV